MGVIYSLSIESQPLFCKEHHLLQEGMAGARVLTVRDYTTNRLGWDTTQTSFFP